MNIKRDSIDLEAELFKLNPTVQVTDPKSPVTHGLTKREYFAAMAMQGLLANPNISCVTSDAVLYADKLIEALNE
jgi:hypothetical protein